MGGEARGALMDEGWIPGWLEDFVRENRRALASDEERMRLVLDLCGRNISDGGGPFAAAIFDEGGGLVSAGTNRVVPASCSLLHAEVLAIYSAERALGARDLSSRGRFTLVTSAQPCLMCMGALLWAGVSAVVAGARGRAAVAALVGFDEGPVPADWAAELGRRGVEVRRDVLRDEARVLLARYRASGLGVYNAGSNPLPCDKKR